MLIIHSLIVKYAVEPQEMTSEVTVKMTRPASAWGPPEGLSSLSGLWALRYSHLPPSCLMEPNDESWNLSSPV